MKPFLTRKDVKPALLVFMGVFLVYAFLGAYITGDMPRHNDLFFGADHLRVYSELTDMAADAGRLPVHPLFRLGAASFTVAAGDLLRDPTAAVVGAQALCGALSVCCFYLILVDNKVGRAMGALFTAIYGASFSMLLFSAVPETFIFACAGLVSYWYFVSFSSKQEGPLSKTEWALLLFWGVLSAAVTVTNYVSYLIGLVTLLSLRCDRKGACKGFCLVNITNAGAGAALCALQKLLWQQSPPFLTNLLQGSLGDYAGEAAYMNWQLSWEKTADWLRQTFFYPLFSGEVHLLHYYKNSQSTLRRHSILFSGYGALWAKILPGVLFVLLTGCILLRLLHGLRRSHRRENGFFFGLLGACCANLALHYVYGYNYGYNGLEGFLYSPHYLFLTLAAGALAVDRAVRENPKVRRCIVGFLGVFALGQAYNNLHQFFAAADLAIGAERALYAQKAAAMLLPFGCVACALWLAAVCASRWQAKKRPCCGAPAPKLRPVGYSVFAYLAAALAAWVFIAVKYS